MTDYLNGKIYRIVSKANPDLVYYGSTTRRLCQRLANHKSNYLQYKKHNNKRVYTTSFIVLETGDYDMELVECISCNDKRELWNRERYYIENNNCVNKCIPTRTPEEYALQYRDRILKQKTEYYYGLPITHCPCGGKYTNRKNRHETSMRHLEYLEGLKNISPNI